MVDEDEYASIVERRRNEDDFVVDDSECSVTDLSVTLEPNIEFIIQMDSDTTMMERNIWAWRRTRMMVSTTSFTSHLTVERCTHSLRAQLIRHIYISIVTAKKRLKEAARDGDNRLSKKARKLAENSQGPKNSILRHMQATGPGAAGRAPATKKESKYCFFYAALSISRGDVVWGFWRSFWSAVRP